ncbi:AraC family transcriptional regulator ligand-binding domain-containing protein [Pseudomonas aeruginosa]|uniref:AraC family transcriptional regulator n=1 Tax=Pseudomonas aeruginosa TaxID=287 RepID=UPI003EE06A5C
MHTSAASQLLAPTIPVEFVFDALQACPARGADVTQLLTQAGLALLQPPTPGDRVSVVDYSRLLRLIIERLDDSFLGFLDRPVPPKAFAVFASQLVACDNAAQAITQLNRFYKLFSDQFYLEVLEQPEHSVIRLHFRQTQSFDYRFIQQSLLIVVLRLIHWLIGKVIQPEAVHFTFAKNHLHPHLHYLFGGPLHYASPYNELHFAHGVLQVPCATTQAQVEVMVRDSQRMMLINHRPAPFTHAVRKILLLHSGRAWLSAVEVAASLQLSPNLLWRKLKREQTSFQEIRDALKRDLSLSLLTNDQLTLDDIAARVGFAEASSFHKAFSKWTGFSPSTYRRSKPVQ